NPDHMRKVADMVNDRILKTSGIDSRLDLTRLAVLAAMNIADEMLKLRADHDELLHMAAERESLEAELAQARAEAEACREQLDAQKQETAGQAEALRAQLAAELVRIAGAHANERKLLKEAAERKAGELEDKLARAQETASREADERDARLVAD